LLKNTALRGEGEGSKDFLTSLETIVIEKNGVFISKNVSSFKNALFPLFTKLSLYMIND